MSKYFYILLVVITGLLAFQFFKNGSQTEHGKLAPQIQTTLIDGSPFTLEDLRGDYVLLDFWASWCGPCRKSNPQLVSLYHDYKSKKSKSGQGFDIVSVALEKNDKNWRKAAERDGFVWKNQIVDVVRFVRLSVIANDYGVTQIPTKFLLNPEGEIIAIDPTFEEVRKLLDQRL